MYHETDFNTIAALWHKMEAYNIPVGIYGLRMIMMKLIVFFSLQAAVSSLKQEYKENETTIAEAQALAIKVLSKTLDMTKLTPEKGN